MALNGLSSAFHITLSMASDPNFVRELEGDGGGRGGIAVLSNKFVAQPQSCPPDNKKRNHQQAPHSVEWNKLLALCLKCPYSLYSAFAGLFSIQRPVKMLYPCAPSPALTRTLLAAIWYIPLHTLCLRERVLLKGTLVLLPFPEGPRHISILPPAISLSLPQTHSRARKWVKITSSRQICHWSFFVHAYSPPVNTNESPWYKLYCVLLTV